MDVGPLATLERAELAARERRLAASAEAERIETAGAERAAAIAAGVPERVAQALAELRRTHDERAAREIEATERELADLEAGPVEPDTDPSFAAAVELVVAAVLGERLSPASSEPEPPTPAAVGAERGR